MKGASDTCGLSRILLSTHVVPGFATKQSGNRLNSAHETPEVLMDIHIYVCYYRTGTRLRRIRRGRVCLCKGFIKRWANEFIALCKKFSTSLIKPIQECVSIVGDLNYKTSMKTFLLHFCILLYMAIFLI